MRQTGFPVQMPTQVGSMPPVRLAQPASQGWSPARRTQPMMAQRTTRPSGPVTSGKMGQTEAAIWARGSDITFSILTGLAAMVGGIGIILERGRAVASVSTPAPPRAPGAPPRPPVVRPGKKASTGWYVAGVGIALLGAINIFASISRAASLQIPMEANSSARTGS